MRLAERGRELAALAAVLREAEQGRGSIAVVSGGIGCGRTELLDTVRRSAADAGYVVLGATGSWAERDSPGSVLGQLLRYAQVPAAHGDRVTAALTRSLGTGPETGGSLDQWPPGPATTAALHRLSTELVRIADHTPVLLCVDDLQYADSLSLHWILQFVRVLRSARVALVVAECTLSKSAHPQLHAQLLRQPNYRRITLGALSVDGVAAVLAERVGEHRARALAAESHRVSGGSPLLVRALAQDQRHAVAPPGGPLPEPVVADAYADTVLSCLHRGRPPTFALAQALAVLDEQGTGTALLARLLDEEPATVEQCLAALRGAGLIDGVRLRHPVARTAVLQSLSAADRRALHRRAAELLCEDGASAWRIAPHLIAADSGCPPWAGPVLREAAQRYLAVDRAAEAHACLAAALAGCEDDGERVALRAQLAATAWLLNPSLTARHLGELAEALRDGRLPDRHALTLAKHLLWHGRFAEAVEAIERMGRRSESAELDPAAAAEVRATRELLSTTYPSLVGSAVLAAPGTTDAPPRAAAGDPRILGATALTRVLAHGADPTAVGDAETALRALRLAKSTQESLMCAVAALMFAERVDAAASWCDHWLAEARTRRVPLWEAEFTSLRAGIRLRQGDPVTARALAEKALALVPAESWGVCLGGPLAVLVQAATETGDIRAAEGYLAVPVLDGMYSTRFGLYFLHARGRHHLSTGRPYAALDDFMTCARLMRDWGFDQPTLVPWRTEAARAHLALGDTGRALALAREQLALVGPERTRTRGLTLRVLAAADSGEQTGPLTEAAEILRASGDELQTAGALAELGREHLRAGRPARARPVLEMAAQLARRCGARPLAAALATDLDGLEPRRGRPRTTADAAPAGALALLSGAERRVAALAAGGHTNREISERLCITVSTVEQHLTRIFRKLGVRARREIPADIVLEAAE
ncbi:AAA family ATPase [Streptomyces sp. NPDC018693]|uniref:helix-turn-helix transcriptional regulator n=1 Tax=unclassified Streptomyces TaxID=2593676 RepID=UPI0037B9A551